MPTLLARLRSLLALSCGVLCAAFTLGCAADTSTAAAEESALLELSLQSGPRLRADLEAIRASDDLLGLAAELETERGSEHARAGSNDPRGHAPLPWDAQFRVASVSKTFTAVVVLQLVQEGKLALSDSVERWLPGVVRGHGNDGKRISVQQLLQHQSGLSDYVQSPALGSLVGSLDAFGAHRFDAITDAEYLAYALAQPPLFAPGAQFSYSGTNYLLLGMLIEAASGQSWRAQVEHRIVAPLSLSHTYVPGWGPFLVAPHVRGYARFPEHNELVDVTNNSLISSADDGVVSSLSDLNRFFRALVRGELLSPALLGTMQTTVPIENSDFPDGRYGLGLQWSPLSCGGGYWHHAGDTLGYWVRTGVTADGGRSVALVINSPVERDETVAAANALVDRALCEQRPR